MTYQIRRANRGEAKPLVGLYAQSGAGKTWSALLLARGFAPKGRIVMIETEGGRGEAYVDMIDGGYDVISMRDDFSPIKFGQAISVAEQALPEVLIMDSASHEWEGAGGVLDMAANNQQKYKGQLVWQKPKMDHSRHFMLRMLQTRVPLVILCMRAKYPMYERKNAKGEKEWVRSEQLEPIQAADILYEMFVHGWIDVPTHSLHLTKLTRPDLAAVFLDNEPITLDTGARLAAWSKQIPVPAAAPSSRAELSGATTSNSPAPGSSMPVLAMAREAAVRGREQLRSYCKTLTAAQLLEVTRHKDELELLIPKENA